MNEEFDSLKYYMASEKTVNLIFTIEQLMEFMDEYKIPADEEVKKALKPLVDKLQNWIK